MSNVLVLVHTDDSGALGRPALEAVGLAAGLGRAVVIGIVGASVQSAADSLAELGAAAVYAVEGEAFGVGRYATDAAAAEAICRAAECGLVVAPGTSRWMRALPGVAQRTGAKVDSHVVGLSADGVARRWVYRNRMEASLTRTEPWIVLLDGGAAPAWSGAAGPVQVQRLAVEVASRTEVLRVETPAADQQTIRPEAKLLLVAGAGWTKKQKDGQSHIGEAAELIQDVLKLTGASLGSSKSLVDMGSEGQSVLPFLTHLHQVGQTGSSPRHAKGLATCCHGEEPHVVGWRFVNERRAVNLDANCGWARKKADVLYVADAFDVARELRKLLGASGVGA